MRRGYLTQAAIVIVMQFNFICVLNATAAVRTWTGGIDDFWFRTENWTPNGIPTINDTLIVLPEATNPPNTRGFPVAVNSGGSINISGGTSTFGNLIVGANGGVSLSGGTVTTTNMDASSGGAFTSSPDSTLIVNSGSLSIGGPNNSTLSGAFSGTGGLIKIGTGATTFTGNNTYTGRTLVLNGSLVISGVSATLNETSGLSINSPGILTLQNQATINTDFIDGNGALQLLGGALRITGTDGLKIGTDTTTNPNTPFSPLGSDLNLGIGQRLTVSHTATIDNGSLTVDKGSFTVGSLSTINGGQFEWVSGTVSFTDDTVFNAPFATELGFDKPIDSSKTLIFANGLTLDTPLTIAGGTVATLSVQNPHNLILSSGEFLILQDGFTVAAGKTIDIGSGMEFTVLNNELIVQKNAVLNVLGEFKATDGLNDGQINAVNALLTFRFEELENNGELNLINSTLTFSSGGRLDNNAKLTLVNATINGAVKNTASASVDVTGTATFTGDVSGQTDFGGTGTVIFEAGYAPGFIPGAVGFGGSLDFASTSTYEAKLQGATPGLEHDQINVTHNVSLDGTLDVTLLDGYTPNYLDEFQVIIAGSRTGEFTTITGAMIDPDITLAPVYDYNGNIGLTLIAALPGDANLDGIVNGQDLLAWQANLFSGDEWMQGDFNLDGLVSGLDLLIWQSHLFDSVALLLPSPSSVASLAVPEPSTLSVFVLILIGSAIGPRARRQV